MRQILYQYTPECDPTPTPDPEIIERNVMPVFVLDLDTEIEVYNNVESGHNIADVSYGEMQINVDNLILNPFMPVFVTDLDVEL